MRCDRARAQRARGGGGSRVGIRLFFGRGGEEAEPLARAHIEFEVVPGLPRRSRAGVCGSAVDAIASTDRFVAFVTGHEDASKGASAVPWDALVAASRRGGTLVILMATARMRADARTDPRCGTSV